MFYESGNSVNLKFSKKYTWSLNFEGLLLFIIIINIFQAVGLHVTVDIAFLNGPESFHSIWMSAIKERYGHIRCYMHVS